jgi:flagellar biosynthesis protein FliR
MSITLAPDFAIAFMLVFARVGALMMLLPGFGEQVAPSRVRLSIALFVTLATLPLVRAGLPISAPYPQLVQVLIGEVLIGLTFGLATRFLTSSLQIAGTIISQQMGLSFTMTFDPTGSNQGQSATIGNFLSLLGITLVLASDLHHVALVGIIDTYKTIVPGATLPSGDAIEMVMVVAVASFTTGIQISAPFIVFGLVFNVGLGILSRMMPQLQVFFLAMPAMILIGTIVFILVLGLMMDGFLANMMRIYGEIFPGLRG